MKELATLELRIGTLEGTLSPKDSRELRKRLMRIGVDRAEFGEAEAVPEGAKAGEILTLATITLALIPAVYPDVIKFLKDWVGLSRNRRVKIRKRNADKEVEVEYDLDDVEYDQIAELMELLDREIR